MCQNICNFEVSNIVFKMSTGLPHAESPGCFLGLPAPLLTCVDSSDVSSPSRPAGTKVSSRPANIR